MAYVVIKGLPAWNADFFTQVTSPRGSPAAGCGTPSWGPRRSVLIATAVTVPLGLTCGLFLAQSDGQIADAVRFAADVMTGVPSITIGIFGYIAIVTNIGHYSGLAGAFAIGIIMLPVIIRAGETAIRGVPRNLSEAALALGARRATIARRVVVPAALPGVITGVLLAVARGPRGDGAAVADHLRQPVHAVEPDQAHGGACPSSSTTTAASPMPTSCRWPGVRPCC